MIKRMLRAVLLLIDMLLIVPVSAAEFVLMVFRRIRSSNADATGLRRKIQGLLGHALFAFRVPHSR